MRQRKQESVSLKGKNYEFGMGHVKSEVFSRDPVEKSSRKANMYIWDSKDKVRVKIKLM